MTKEGSTDPVESRYIPQELPSKEDVQDMLRGFLDADDSVSFRYLEDLYDHMPVRVLGSILRDALSMMGLGADSTTGRFILFGEEPTTDEIATVLRNQGTRLRPPRSFEIFPARVRDLDKFEEDLFDLCYFDHEEERWFLLSNDLANGGFLSPEDSMRERDHYRIRLSKINDQIAWGRELSTYVPSSKPAKPLSWYGWRNWRARCFAKRHPEIKARTVKPID